MRHVLIGLAVLVAISGLTVGYIYLTTVTDVAVGPGWRLAAAARGGPWSFFSDEPAHAEVVADQEALTDLYSVLEVSTQPPRLDFIREVVIRATAFGSGSCPEHFRRPRHRVRFSSRRCVPGVLDGLLRRRRAIHVPADRRARRPASSAVHVASRLR